MAKSQGTPVQRTARSSRVMLFLKAFLIFAVLAALLSYWLYTPLPPGFSSDSSFEAQGVLIAFKLAAIGCRVISFIGYGSEVELYRSIANDVLKENSAKTSSEGIETTDVTFDGVPVRIYQPSDPQSSESLPAIIYFHSGGFLYGSIETAEMITRRLCKDTGAIVVSVEYRLAPEFPFPAAFDDCTAATMHLLLNAADYNVDDRRIAVAGDGAGGNLATTVALKLRDEDFPVPLKLQVLLYPTTQALDFDLPSMIQHGNGPLLTRRMIVFSSAVYVDGNTSRVDDFSANRHLISSVRRQLENTFLDVEKLPKEFTEGYERPSRHPEGGGGENGDEDRVWDEDRMLEPYHSPLMAENLADLPEAFVLTANHDPLRDEGWLYVLRLREAENTVTHYNADIGFHGMFSFLGKLPEVEPMFAKITEFIVKRL